MRQTAHMIIITLFSIATACGDSGSSSSSTAKLTVTATILSGGVSEVIYGVKANGSNKVTINVDGATSAPISLRTQQGTFADGTTSATINGRSGFVDLTVCNAHTSSTCAGNVIVTASDANEVTGRITLSFIGYETICNNSIDDNNDTNIDCADPDCATQACILNKTAGTCQNLVCVTEECTPTKSTDICNNNIDDDCDGNTDCEDSDCDAQSCLINSAAGTCQNSVCVAIACTPTQTTEICDNNIDDDCDTNIDCADSDCADQTCKTNSSNFICKNNVCTDTTSGYGLTLVPKRKRLPADGGATTTITATLTYQGEPKADTNITLTTNLSTFIVNSTTPTTTTIVTDSNGIAEVTYKASANAGVATITAALTLLPQISISALVTMPALGSIQVKAIQNQVMGVKYSGWNEQNLISVMLLDTEQNPYPDGLAVRFQHQRLGGSSISTPWTADIPSMCLQANKCLGYQTQTSSPTDQPDTTGLAYVNLYSGTVAGLVSVIATASAGGTTQDFTIQNIAIVGAKVNGAHIALDCTPKNIPALMDTDCLHTFYAGKESPIQCTSYFADRFNNVLGKSLLVTFASEAGAAGQPVATGQYDPTQGTDQTSSLGFVTNTIAVTGYGLPADVAPFTSDGELSFDNPSGSDVCGVTTYNQRDGLSTIIVMATGEEGFVDSNGNGYWDTGEPFIDQGEPFIDADDDGAFDTNEYFVDLNGNNTWDMPNGIWDSDTTLWTETRVLYTGIPVFATGFSSVAPDTQSIPASSSKMSTFYFMDRNQNPISPAATFATQPEMALVTAKILYSPTSVDNLGLSFTQQYCDQPAGSTPTVCASTCPSSPCYLVSKIYGYDSAVSSGVVAITSGSTSGTDTIDIIPTIDKVIITPGLQVDVTVP
ncbi:MAG: hypothetical protein JW841_15395 [Deltaproteobacteria bacterium]|nr:hypothetical protein [Deltaproteobacteria bacterium]